ncbi:MAG TPA: TonB-dependent receptor, partial [Steroidobacteraceae bacterium]|nr:TonB-dependent receptor [Steroidobacteraceae bacterium]
DFMQGSDTNQRSEELRAASRDDAPVRWIAGGYFFDETAFWTTLASRANPALTNVTVPGASIPADGFTSFIPFTVTRQMDKVYSGYGQLEFEPVEKLRLTAGLRFTSEKKSGVVQDGIVTQTMPTDPTAFVGDGTINQLLVGATQVPAGSALRLACPAPLPFTECFANTPYDLESNLVGGKISIDYRFDAHTLAYASVSRGFKAGGVSIGALDYTARGGSEVLPEHLLTYEVGLKGQWFDNRVRANSAIFLNDWRNQQLFLPLNTPGTGLNPVYTNVPRTQSYGFEEELEWAPTVDWYLKTSLGLLHSEVKEVGSALAQSDGALVGSELIASPKVTWSGLVRKEWAAPGGTVSLEGNWSYTGAQHFDLVNSPDQIEPGYWLFNSRAAYQFGATRQYDLSVWGKNLTGTQYCIERESQAGIPFGNTAVCVPNEARRFFGLTFNARF